MRIMSYIPILPYKVISVKSLRKTALSFSFALLPCGNRDLLDKARPKTNRAVFYVSCVREVRSRNVFVLLVTPHEDSMRDYFLRVKALSSRISSTASAIFSKSFLLDEGISFFYCVKKRYIELSTFTANRMIFFPEPKPEHLKHR